MAGQIDELSRWQSKRGLQLGWPRGMTFQTPDFIGGEWHIGTRGMGITEHHHLRTAFNRLGVWTPAEEVMDRSASVSVIGELLPTT